MKWLKCQITKTKLQINSAAGGTKIQNLKRFEHRWPREKSPIRHAGLDPASRTN
jgi:hypothetical protein